MLFSEINPFIRYARYMDLNKKACYNEVIPLDARLFYAICGYGKIKVESIEYEMHPGSLLIINSGVPYQVIAPEDSVKYIVFNFDYTQKASSYRVPTEPVLKDSFKREMLIDYNTFEDAEMLSGVVYIKKIDLIHTRLTAIVREYMKKLLYHEQKSGHMLAECIADSMRFLKIGDLDFEKASSNRIISYIQNHYSENLTNHSIGKLFGYHPNYVSFLIKQITGMPIHQYIIRVRLINAVNLLENTALSINEIATACGFCDAAYFSGYFKKYFGITPSKYKTV